MGDRGWLPQWRTPRAAPFARASEEPYRRRAVDALKLVAAVALTAVLASSSGDNSEVSLSVFHAVNGLRGDLRPLADLLYDIATLWSVAVIAVAALVARRWRLARDLLLAGGIAWLVSRGLGLVLATGFRRGLSATVRSRDSPDFPNVPLAVVVAVVMTASPFLTRPLRWVGRWVALLLVPVEMYLGIALPKSLVCAGAVGALAAAAVLLAFGSPGGRPTSEQVEAALQDLGVVAAHGTRLARVQPAGHTLMLAEDGDARLMVKVLGRDERDAQRLAKVARFVMYRDSGPTLFLTRVQEVEHQAYVMLLAQQAGVRLAPLVVAGAGGPDTVLLAERRVPGVVLSGVPADELSDEVLQDVWLQVGQLHHARIAHGRLVAGNVVVDEGAATLVGFNSASGSASEEQRAADVAELLATTAGIVGTRTAVAAAAASLGHEALTAALPLLQPAVLSRDARRDLGRSRTDLAEDMTELREAVVEVTGVPMPELERLRRVSGPTAALAVGLVIAAVSLLTAVGDPSALVGIVEGANPAALSLAVLLALASNLGFVLALSGSTRRRLPFWTNLKVQVAGAFSNLALPLGSQALQIRFLQRQGLSTAAAVTGGGLVNLSGGVLAQVGLVAVAAQASPDRLDPGQIPTGPLITTIEVGTLLTLVVSAVVLSVPRLRHLVLPPFTRGVQSLGQVVRSPRQLGLLVGGSVLAYLLTSLALAATLAAVHQSLPIAEIIAVSTGVTLIAALVPLPGGGGAVSAVGLSGALVGLGVPQSAAVAAALLNQLVAQYAGAVPGWFALRSLLKHGDL